ncbi:MAG: RNA polymerase sigma factor [Sphingobacteriia bacterium]|nr:RNA polymerase sigma factor [Sphingobacteriia bacterium]
MTAIEFNHKLLGLQDNLKNFAYALTSDSDDANDLVQDTFLKAITYRDKFNPDTNLKAWAYTIMKNTFINNYRKNIRENAFVDTTEDLYYLNIKTKSSTAAPDSSLRSKEITRTIENLEDEHRIPFVMYTQGYKYKEIAEKMNLSIGTVKSRIFFSRKKLMNSLKDYQN